MKTITPIIEQFIADVCAGKTNSTPAAYRSKLARFARWLGPRPLGKLSAEDITSFMRAMQNQSEKRVGTKIVKGNLSPFTIHTVLRTVKHFLRWSHEHGFMRADLSHFKTAPLPQPDPKAVSPENVMALMLAAARTGAGWEQARNLALLYVMRDSGGRIGAILSADMDNLDLAHGKLFVKEKGDKPLTLYLNPPAVLALIEWLKARPGLNPKCRHLFITCRGRGLTRPGWYSLLNRLLDAADLRGKGRCNAHAWRHAFARDSLTAGEDLSKVSQTMGHSSVRVTADYYARWADRELQEAHGRFSPGAKLAIIKPKDCDKK